jgi:hypothetical protein
MALVAQGARLGAEFRQRRVKQQLRELRLAGGSSFDHPYNLTYNAIFDCQPHPSTSLSGVKALAGVSFGEED